jgi:hypothetical protein
MPVTAALITAGTTAAIQLGSAAIKNRRANKIAKNNVRPDYVPNEQILQNADIAASRAGQGLSDASKTLYGQENERNLSQSLSAILRGGGGVNQISDLYANNNDAMLKLASLDNQLQNQNITQFLNANTAKGQEIQSAWTINEFDPYANNAQLSALLKGQAVQQLNAAGQTLSQGVSNYYTSQMYKDKSKAVPQTQAEKDAKYKYGNVYMEPLYPYHRNYSEEWYNQEDYDLKDLPDTPSKRYIDSILNNTDNIG